MIRLSRLLVLRESLVYTLIVIIWSKEVLIRVQLWRQKVVPISNRRYPRLLMVDMKQISSEWMLR